MSIRRFAGYLGAGLVCVLASSASANIYVVDQSNNRIQKLGDNGHYLGKWGSTGTGNGQFQGPSGIAIDAMGYLYVADTQNNRVQKFDRNGVFITKWGSGGSGTTCSGSSAPR